MIKKTTEIDAILLNLNKAIDAHYQWLVSMFHSVVARDASKPEITDNHSYGLCQFGRWIDHLGPLDNDEGNDSNLLIVFYVQIMPDDFVMQLHRF